VLSAPGLGSEISLVNPEIVLGSTADASGLYADVNGVRVKVGDIDTQALEFNVANGTVTLDDLDITVSGAAAPLLQAALGSPLIQAGTPLFSADVSFPQL
jgi:hypothetical protein